MRARARPAGQLIHTVQCMMALEGQSAEAYDQTSEQQGEMGIELLAEATLTSGGTVLDLGCGTGQLSCVLAEKVGPNGRVVAVDPDKERLALAREKHRRSNIEYLEADDKTFPIDQYDLIFLNMVIHWIHKKELFERVFNCLKPGGQLAFKHGAIAMFSVVVHLVELVSNHMLRWIGLKLVTMWIAQKCISVNARIHIQSGLKLVRNCSVNRPLRLWDHITHGTTSQYYSKARPCGLKVVCMLCIT